MSNFIFEPGKCDEFFEITFSNNWEYVSAVRVFVFNFINISLKDKDNADRISLAASELVENAVKYSSTSNNAPEIKFILAIDKKRENAIVEINNPASDEAIQVLKGEFDSVDALNPYEAYLKKMQEVAIRNDGKSMLGLARILYVSGCNLNMNAGDGFVRVHADFKL